MGYIGIIAYEVKREKEGVLLKRHWGRWEEERLCRTFDEIAEFLTADLGKAFSVVWSLADFTRSLFALIPKAKLAGFETKNTIYCGRCKIFLAKHLLGLTNDKVISGNIVTRQEANIYQLEHWFPDGETPPKDTAELAKMGNDIVAALEEMGLYPKSLSSPVKAYVTKLNPKDYPTYLTMPGGWQPALELASVIGKREWHSVYQVGYWRETFLYDIVGAYSSFMLGLPDTQWATMEHSEVPPPFYNFALLSGRVEIVAPVSPLVHPSGVNPRGVWEDSFTNEEIDFIEQRGLGTFKMKEGYFFTFASDTKPYCFAVSELWKFRQSHNKIVANIARRAAQGMSGLLDEEYPERLGDFYNPLYTAMVRPRCRLKVAWLIYEGNLVADLIAVQVDSVHSNKRASIFERGELGDWKLKEHGATLSLGQGRVWRNGVTVADIAKAFRAKPRANHYEVNGYRIDLSSPVAPDRRFREFPKNGGQALSRIYKSEPIEVGHRG